MPLQSRCLYNVRIGFKLMQNDLDPLLKGKATWSRLPVWYCDVAVTIAQTCLEVPCVSAGSASDGRTEANEPTVAVTPARQMGNAEKEQMRKADRIIMSVLQKVQRSCYPHGEWPPF